jgi:intracellular septation protein
MRYLVHTARPIFEDLIGTLVFYLIFVLTGSVIWAATIGLTIGVAQAVRHKLKREAVPGLLVIGIALTVSLGGLSLLTHSARFLLLKPSIIYCCIGATMLPRGWVKRYVPTIALDLLPTAIWDGVGWAWAWLMIGTAAANRAAAPPSGNVAPRSCHRLEAGAVRRAIWRLACSSRRRISRSFRRHSCRRLNAPSRKGSAALPTVPNWAIAAMAEIGGKRTFPVLGLRYVESWHFRRFPWCNYPPAVG